jgi:hypothetical protein
MGILKPILVWRRIRAKNRRIVSKRVGPEKRFLEPKASRGQERGMGKNPLILGPFRTMNWEKTYKG